MKLSLRCYEIYGVSEEVLDLHQSLETPHKRPGAIIDLKWLLLGLAPQTARLALVRRGCAGGPGRSKYHALNEKAGNCRKIPIISCSIGLQKVY